MGLPNVIPVSADPFASIQGQPAIACTGVIFGEDAARRPVASYDKFLRFMSKLCL